MAFLKMDKIKITHTGFDVIKKEGFDVIKKEGFEVIKKEGFDALKKLSFVQSNDALKNFNLITELY